LSAAVIQRLRYAGECLQDPAAHVAKLRVEGCLGDPIDLCGVIAPKAPPRRSKCKAADQLLLGLEELVDNPAANRGRTANPAPRADALPDDIVEALGADDPDVNADAEQDCIQSTRQHHDIFVVQLSEYSMSSSQTVARSYVVLYIKTPPTCSFLLMLNP
jgi:hypothetical protein